MSDTHTDWAEAAVWIVLILTIGGCSITNTYFETHRPAPAEKPPAEARP